MCIVLPSPSSTSLRGQILSEDELSFYRGQSLFPDHNPTGEGTYGGGAEATVSDFPSNPMTSWPSLMTSGYVWTSFPHDISAGAQGAKRRSRGSSVSDLAKRTLKEHLSKSSSLYFFFFSESWQRAINAWTQGNSLYLPSRLQYRLSCKILLNPSDPD